MKRIKIFIIGSLVVACVMPLGSYGAEFVYEAKGKRDPFVPLVGYRKQAVAIEDILTIDDVYLEGIAVGPKRDKIAIINGVMFKEGDRVGNMEIRKISAESVTVFKDGQEREVALTVLEE